MRTELARGCHMRIEQARGWQRQACLHSERGIDLVKYESYPRAVNSFKNANYHMQSFLFMSFSGL